MNPTISRIAIAAFATSSIFVGAGQAFAGDATRDDVAPKAICYKTTSTSFDEGETTQTCDVEDVNGLDEVTFADTSGSQNMEDWADCETEMEEEVISAKEWKQGERVAWIRVLDCQGNEVKFVPEFKE